MKTLIFLAALMTFASCTLAAPSGLNVIPTTDVLDTNTAELEIQTTSVNIAGGDQWDDYYESQYGLGRNIEFGLDSSVSNSGSGQWLNFKYRLITPAKNRAGLAIGVQNLAHGSIGQGYAVTSFALKKVRLHAGLQGIEGNWQGIFGADHEINDWLTLQVDYTTGLSNFFTIGIDASYGTFSLDASALRGNSSDAGDGYMLTIGWESKI